MQPQTLKSYFKKRALIALVVLFICAVVFIYAMQISSVVVLADEAMRTRVEYAIGSDSTMQSETYLSRFFSEEYINTGELQALRASYENCTISSYIQLASVQWVWTWPWGGTAYIKVHDEVGSITGDVIDDTSGTQKVPDWPSGVYALKLTKHNGIWLVVSMELVSADGVAPSPQPTE